MGEARSWAEMMRWCAELLEKRTGAGVPEWNERVRQSGMETEPSLRAWLAERDVTGYPQMLLVMERFGNPEFLQATADELIDGQYADRPGLRPILDRVLAVSSTLGELHVQARKTYVSLVSPRRQFAVIKPTTRTRVDLGLRLEPQLVGGRLQLARGIGNDSITVRIGLQSADEVDDEVVEWLHRTYAANA